MANWFVGNSYGILWLVPLCVLLFSTLYLISYLGQRRGNRQMRMLKNFLKQAIAAREIAE
jgi:integral membrane sensor domain MASE1